MRFEEIKELKEDSFRRLTGIREATFNKMLEILKKEEIKKKNRGGKPNKLLIEDRLIMSLEYWREYRTYFHISKDFGISESSCYRNIKWIEDTLIKEGTFSLPNRKESLSNTEIEIILVDATESPIERPKKNKNNIIQEKRKDIQ